MSEGACDCCSEPPGTGITIEWKSKAANRHQILCDGCGTNEVVDGEEPIPGPGVFEEIRDEKCKYLSIEESPECQPPCDGFFNVEDGKLYYSFKEVYSARRERTPVAGVTPYWEFNVTDTFTINSDTCEMTSTRTGTMASLSNAGSSVTPEWEEWQYQLVDSDYILIGGNSYHSHPPSALEAMINEAVSLGIYSYERTYTGEILPKEPPEPFREDESSLINRTMTAFGEVDFGDTWDGDAGSHKIETRRSPDATEYPNELTHYDVQSSRYRLKHGPTGTCFLRVWLEKIFIPQTELGEDPPEPEVSSAGTYTWTGSGNPCIDLENPEANIFYDSTEGALLPIPEEVGYVTVQVKKYSYLPDYTPSDSDPVNGFPPLPE